MAKKQQAESVSAIPVVVTDEQREQRESEVSGDNDGACHIIGFDALAPRNLESVIPEPVPVAEPEPRPVIPETPEPIVPREKFYPKPIVEAEHSPINQMIIDEKIPAQILVNKKKFAWLIRCMVQGQTRPIFGQAAITVLGELLGARSHQESIDLWNTLKEEKI
jgi:hypothetical protein